MGCHRSKLFTYKYMTFYKCPYDNLCFITRIMKTYYFLLSVVIGTFRSIDHPPNTYFWSVILGFGSFFQVSFECEHPTIQQKVSNGCPKVFLKTIECLHVCHIVIFLINNSSVCISFLLFSSSTSVLSSAFQIVFMSIST